MARGRQRYERSVDGNVVVTIWDPVEGRVVTLRDGKATVRTTHVGRVVALDAQGPPQACEVPPGWAAMGTEMVAGQEACHDKQDGRELWRSRAYRMPVKAIRDDSRLGTVTQTVVEFVGGGAGSEVCLWCRAGTTIEEVPGGSGTNARGENNAGQKADWLATATYDRADCFTDG